jgi:hypothetical protein
VKLWTVVYVDRRDNLGLHSKVVEARTFREAWRSLESDDVVCVKSCHSKSVADLIRLIDEQIG